jgi:hypothetical protein
MNDFIIVGNGLAACAMAHALYAEGASFKMIGVKEMSVCSRVAGGVWNPVVFKRLTKSWLADDLLPCVSEFYAGCEATLGRKLVTERTIVRPFSEEQEKTLWKKKAVNELADYLDPGIYKKDDQLSGFKIPDGYGIVKGAGSLNMPVFLDATLSFFSNSCIHEVFDHSLLKITRHGIEYKSVKARQIVFCEGYRIAGNPFFSWVPLKPAKGETLTIFSENIRLKDSIFTKNGFLMDMGDHIFKAGSTYNWEDLTDQPTNKGREEVREKISEITECEYKIATHEAGVRPSSIDRRPVIGPHPLHGMMHVFNGLGTKGIMLAPYFVRKFVNFSLHQGKINGEVHVKRFYHLYDQQKET